MRSKMPWKQGMTSRWGVVLLSTYRNQKGHSDCNLPYKEMTEEEEIHAQARLMPAYNVTWRPRQFLDADVEDGVDLAVSVHAVSASVG